MLWRLTGLLLAVLGSAVLAGEVPSPDKLRAWIEADQVITVDLTPGRLLGIDDVDALAAVVPPGYIEQLYFPEIEVEVQAPTDLAPHAIYREATAAHAAASSLAPDGSLKGYVAGQPFTHDRIAAASAEQAGLMVAWNNVHRWDYYGYRLKRYTNFYLLPGGASSNSQRPDFLKGNGVLDRSVSSMFHRVFLSHLPMLAEQGYRMDVSDSERLLYKDYMEFTDPFDVAGTRFVIERALDPHESDQVYSYLPKERRVRRLSARERADSFMGTEYSLDDFDGFSGRVLDYNWTLLGEKSILAVADSKHQVAQFFGPSSSIPHDRWQLRDCYVVEAVPTWAGHPYAARFMFVDKQTNQTRLALVIDRQQRLWKAFPTIYQWPVVSGERGPADTVSRWKAAVGTNLINGTNTVTHAMESDNPAMEASDIRRMFSASKLTGGR